jgi:hypothetical protein
MVKLKPSITARIEFLESLHDLDNMTSEQLEAIASQLPPETLRLIESLTDEQLDRIIAGEDFYRVVGEE